MKDNLAFQDHILEWLGRTGGTVVVPTKRLANVLRHRCREKLRLTGRNGWARPKIENLNQFVRGTWARSWPDEARASDICCWRIWHGLLGAKPPPGHLPPTVDLARQLNEAYEALVRNGLDPAGGTSHTPLSAWRASLSADFNKQLAERRLFHPEQMLNNLADSILHERCTVPETLMFAGFASPAPIERRLFEVVRARSEATFLALPDGPRAGLRAVSLPDFEQEMYWLGQQVVQAAQQSSRLAEIGIVLADISGYQDAIQRVLTEVLGENQREGKESYSNLGLSQSLLRRPLVQAALLPLRLAREPTRTHLMELILSPYYAGWHAARQELAKADTIWRSDNLDQSSISDFEKSLAAESPRLSKLLAPRGPRLSEIIAKLQPSSQHGQGAKLRPGSDWVAALEEAWLRLGFPSFLEPHEQAQFDLLSEVLSDLSSHLQTVQLTASQLTQWIEAALDRKPVGTVGDELNGVQVVGFNESRGLWFDRVFVPGLTAFNLPRPVRRFPLLSTAERERVQGGSTEGQFEFAKNAVSNLQATAGGVTLSRPLASGQEPLPASPFWPSDLEKPRSLSFWSAPDVAWLRAPWVAQSWRGSQQEPSGIEDTPSPGRLPGQLSASKLETLLGCPMRFFAEVILSLGPLDEPYRGIDALSRGSRLHDILQRFVDEVLSQGLSLDTDAARCEALLCQCVDEVIGESASNLAWRVERQRLVGDSATPPGGLLGKWLADQREHAAAGWRVEKTETDFSGLQIPDVAFEIRGRIDRVDRHPERGLMVWDYKSGAIPRREKVTELFTQPQLPTYLAALKAGLVEDLEGQQACAGYWQVKSEKEQGPATYGEDASFWQDVLKRFESRVVLASRDAEAGEYPPAPLDAGQDEKLLLDVCEHCDVRTFCASQGQCGPDAGEPKEGEPKDGEPEEREERQG